LKRLGLESYWGFSQFRTGSGQGYINLSTGNLAYQSIDFVFPGSKLAEVMRRTYNSQSTTKTPLGYGFDFSFNTNLLKEYDALGKEAGIILKDGDGSIHRFSRNADGSYTAGKGNYMVLTYDSSQGSFSIKRKDNILYSFDKNMRLTSFSDANGNYLKLSYNSRGNVDTVKDNFNNTLTLEYDSKDRLLKATDPANRIYNYMYDNSSDKLIKMYTIIENNIEYAEEFGYDSAFKYITVIKDPKKNITKLDYPNGKLVKVTNAINEYFTLNYGSNTTSITSDRGKTVTFSYNSLGNITKKTDTLGNNTNYEYDDNYNVTRISYVNTVAETDKELNYYYTYDLNGNILTSKDPLENVTEYSNYNSFNEAGQVKNPISAGSFAVTVYAYDCKGNLLSVKDPEGRTSSNTYDSYGNITTSTDNFGNITNYDYDSKGRLVKITEPQGKITETIAFDVQNNPIKVKDALGNITETAYDLLGRPIKTIYPDGKYTISVYDLNSNLKQSTNKRSYTTMYDYDALDRLKSVLDAEGKTTTTTYSYGSDNNVIVTVADAEGRISKAYYDSEGRIKREESGGTYTDYEYDRIGNTIKQTDAEGRISKVLYNELNQAFKVIQDPQGKNIINEFTFDLLGNKLTSKDGENNVTNYEYDKIGRLKKVTNTVETETISTSNQYDLKDGMLVYNKSIDGLGRETFTYFDSLGRKVKEVKEGTIGDSDRQITIYEYNLNNNLKKLTKPDGNSINYDYDVLDRLKQITYDSSNYTAFAYDDNGNRTSMKDVKDGKVTETTYAYDGLDELYQYVQDGNTVTYSYDGSGNKTKVSYAAGNETKNIEYKYDMLNRLNSILLNNQKTADYSYDKVGNRLTMSNGTDSYKYDYNQFNSLKQISKNGSIETTFTYDANGNETKEIAGTKTTSYGYDKADRLITLTIADGSTSKNISNIYNGDGQRIKQIEDGVTTKYYYDGGKLLYTADSSNNKLEENILDPSGTIIASKRFDGNYANKYFFYNYDIRGSVSSIINPEGSLVKGYDYDEFGKTADKGDSLFKNTTKFTGAVHDLSANLYYMDSRFYNPITGRFLTQDTYSGDPYEPWTQHLYSYCSNDPVNFIDPTGHSRRMANEDGGSGESNYSASNIYMDSKYAVKNTNTAVIRSRNTSEKIRDIADVTLSSLPGIGMIYNEANNVAVACTGIDLAGRAHYEDEIQDKKLFLYVDIMTVAISGAASGALNGAGEAYYHSANPSVVDIMKESGFRTDLPNPQAAWKNNRFGRGVYLADSPATALAERPGGTILKINADTGKNLNLTNRGIIDYDMGQAIARGARKHGYNSITFLSNAAKEQGFKGANTMIFDPTRVSIQEVLP